MDFIKIIEYYPPQYFAIPIILLSAIFAIAWGFDAITHGRIQATDLTDQELQTHRLILIPSVLAELSLVAMYWNPWLALPFFIGFYLVRTVHEFIDELKFHVDRCSKKESYFHLAMWCTVHIKTAIIFIWGFFTQFQGIEKLNILYFIIYMLILGVLGFISFIEFKR